MVANHDEHVKQISTDSETEKGQRAEHAIENLSNKLLGATELDADTFKEVNEPLRRLFSFPQSCKSKKAAVNAE